MMSIVHISHKYLLFIWNNKQQIIIIIVAQLTHPALQLIYSSTRDFLALPVLQSTNRHRKATFIRIKPTILVNKYFVSQHS